MVRTIFTRLLEISLFIYPYLVALIYIEGKICGKCFIVYYNHWVADV